jgi:hypothetical protein
MSTGAAQVDMEERFCQMVKELGCTCVTISHRPALMAFHDIVLALDGEGGWSLHRGARGLSSEEGPSKLGALLLGIITQQYAWTMICCCESLQTSWRRHACSN